MRPLSTLTLIAVAVVAVTASGIVPTRAAAAGGDCGVPGLVRAPGASCPTTGSGDGAEAHSEGALGWLVGNVAGPALKLIVKAMVTSAAKALQVTSGLIGATTTPDLGSSWFSASYWRVASVSALLTVPFLLAAAVHALVRSDVSLLGRAAFGYLPLAFLAVAIAGPLTTMLLSATDEMSSFVAGASQHADTVFLARAGGAITASELVGEAPFLALFVGALTVIATLALWIELLIRDAAVYVIVLMLPLFFAAMVWPARRVWAIRAVEVLFALILSKFAIVCVLSLGASAISHLSSSGPAGALTGVTLVLLATMSPWALLRLLPIHEVAAAAAGGLSQAPSSVFSQTAGAGLRMLTGGGGDDGRGGGGGEGVDTGLDDGDDARRRALDSPDSPASSARPQMPGDDDLGSADPSLAPINNAGERQPTGPGAPVAAPPVDTREPLPAPLDADSGDWEPYVLNGGEPPRLRVATAAGEAAIAAADDGPEPEPALGDVSGGGAPPPSRVDVAGAGAPARVEADAAEASRARIVADGSAPDLVTDDWPRLADPVEPPTLEHPPPTAPPPSEFGIEPR